VEAVEDELRLLEVLLYERETLEGMRRVLLCVLEAV